MQNMITNEIKSVIDVDLLCIENVIENEERVIELRVKE
jgi:hypothetical protein